jgi:hypothetical protein
VPQAPGIVDENFQWMVKEADKKGIKEHGKRGGILIDEMTIQDDLQIIKKGDSWSIVGAVDMGDMNNKIDIIINNERKVKMATHCLQYIFHGFTGFRWPVAYYASETANAFQIYNTFWDVLSNLSKHGFTVDYVNMDGASTNRLFMHMLCEDLWQSKYIISNIFQRDHKICLLQDIKHVLKKIRNNMEASRSENKSKPGRYIIKDDIPIVWSHWEEAYKFNIQDGFPIHRKLTEEHILLTPVSKMRNGLASDVLNSEMLYLMKLYQGTLDNPARLASTMELLENTSILVNIFLDKRPITNLQDNRLKKLEDVLSYFKNWENEITNCKMFNPSKNLMTAETRVQAFRDSYPCVVYQLGMGLVLILDT